MNDLLKIPGEGNFKRSPSGAVINTNKSAIEGARLAKARSKEKDEKLDLILAELQHIRKILENQNANK